jgi:hypothetical protein
MKETKNASLCEKKNHQGANSERGIEGAGLRPLLSLHVRRGDSCNPEQEDSKKRKCEDLSSYMTKAVLPMAKKYGVKSVFLATDDEDTVKVRRLLNRELRG